MSIAKDFNKILHKQVRVHAAWLPVTNTFQLGDYGIISDGVFKSMGNIRKDFGVEFTSAAGPPAKLDFKSEHVRALRMIAGAEVKAWPGDDVDASLKIEFGRKKSFYLKADLTVETITNVFDVAQKLASNPRWNAGKFKTISALYTGTNCVILSSLKKNAAVEIAAKAGTLKKIEMGAAEAGVSFTSETGIGLEILGQSGPIGIGMFRVEKRGEPQFEAVISPDESSTWDADLDDDV